MKLLAITAFCLIVRAATSAPSPPEGFDHHMTVVADQYFLYWTVKGDEITFQAQVKTLGYIGLGISPNGGMAGSDIITAWVKDDKVYFQDRYATRNAQPELDEEQNWSVVEGMEKDGYTIITFKRPLVTCDRINDRDITGETTRLIYAYHPEDPADAASIPYHGSKGRGAKSVTLLLYGAGKTADQVPANTKHIDFVLQDFEVPAKPTTYWCKAFKMPELKEKHHIVRFEPIIKPGNEGINHHMVLYACQHEFDEDAHDGLSAECYRDLMGEVDECTSTIFAWAVGGPAINIPEHIGYPFGAGLMPKMMRLEIHYDNPSSASGLVDSGGIRLYYTEDLREFDAGYLTAGASVRSLIIPPNYDSLTVRGHCSRECLSKAIPADEDIKVFAVFLHSHLLGFRMRVRHFRDGKELPPIAKDDYYDFNYQDIRTLPEEVSIKPDDHIIMECDYKSRENFTFGGLGTDEEMCYAFLAYYPKRTFSRCLSIPDPADLVQVIENPTLEFAEDDRPFPKFHDFNITGPEKYAYRRLDEVLFMVDWEDAAVQERFQKIMKQDARTVYQICDEGDTVPLMQNPFARTPNITETYEAPPAECSAGITLKDSGFLAFLVLQLLFIFTFVV